MYWDTPLFFILFAFYFTGLIETEHNLYESYTPSHLKSMILTLHDDFIIVQTLKTVLKIQIDYWLFKYKEEKFLFAYKTQKTTNFEEMETC